jgi:hypothetical protein
MTTRESAVLEVQHSILDVLNGNSHLVTTHGCSTYDFVPEDVIKNTAPYIEIGDPTEINWDFLGDVYGQRLTQRLHVWSTYRGKKEAADIIKHMKELLCDTAITITGYTHVMSKAEFVTVMRDPDKIHYHGVLDLGVYVIQT